MLLHPVYREVRAEIGPEQAGSGPAPGVDAREVGAPDLALGAEDSGPDLQFVQLYEGDDCTGMSPLAHPFLSRSGFRTGAFMGVRLLFKDCRGQLSKTVKVPLI